MTRTLICLKGSHDESLPIIRRAKEMELRIILVDKNKDAIGRPLADVFVCADHYDVKSTLEGLECAGVRLSTGDGVICCAGDMPHVAAAVAQRFGLPGLTPEQARLSCDKECQKRALWKAKIPAPRFNLIVSVQDWGRPLDTDTDFVIAYRTELSDTSKPFIFPYRFLKDVSVSSILKPIDSRGGRGVIRLLPGVDQIWAYEQAKAQSPSKSVMTEEWLDGPQLNSESIIQDGRVLFTALSWRNYARLDEFAPYVIEDGLDIIQHDTELYVRVNTVLTAACAALGWGQTGAGMTVKGDLVIHKGQVYVIELAARLSGGHYATHTIPLAYGVPFVDWAIFFALGERIEKGGIEHVAVPYDDYVSQRYVFPAPGDIGKTVVSVKEPEDYADYASWYIKPGDVIQSVRSHPDRWGQAICRGETEADATARAELEVAEMKKSVVLK